MMANAARDPLWRAKVSAEIDVHPALQTIIENKCTNCHAPMGHKQAHYEGAESYSMAEMSDSPLALDGVSCTLCHQILSENFDSDDSYSGGFAIRNNRQIYGPYQIPFASTMQRWVDYTPRYADYIDESALCATCHTLFTPYVDDEGEIAGEFPEQVPYLEWQNSRFSGDGVSCQNCHMPRSNGSVVIASMPANRPALDPFWKHYFVGGNAFMLGQLGDNVDELELTASAALFESTASRTLNNLRNDAIDLTATAEWVDGSLFVHAQVSNNQVGHKFPTGIPLRRLWLHLTAFDLDGEVVFESGAWDENGEIIGLDEPYEPHYDFIDSSGQTQIYEGIMHDIHFQQTFTLLRAAGFLKDNRLPPQGFTEDFEDYDVVAVVGDAVNDENFNRNGETRGTGSDRVSYHIPPASSIEIELCYQSVMPAFLDSLMNFETEEAGILREIMQDADNSPVIIASIQLDAPSAVSDNRGNAPLEFSLQSVYPNPFNSTVEIEAQLNISGNIEVVILDLSGREVKRLYSGNISAGNHKFLWDGSDYGGLASATGIYLVRLSSGGMACYRKVALIR